MKRIRLGNRGNKPIKYALIDDADFPLIDPYYWHLDKDGYAQTQINGKRMLMHRLILDAPRHLVTDHKDHNRLNNRRNNIRLATRGQNAANRRCYGSQQYKGVKPAFKKWQAEITCNERTIYIGTFGTKQEAAVAYDAFALQLFGEFARTNFKYV
jgi:hypothetical protein